MDRRYRRRSSAVGGSVFTVGCLIGCGALLLATVALVLGIVALASGGRSGVGFDVQTINYANESIVGTPDFVNFDRLDWKPGTRVLENKCALYVLPDSAPDGHRIIFYNHHRQINILQHPDRFGNNLPEPKAPGNAEFWHIELNGRDQLVELQWIPYNHGWTVVRTEGEGVHVQTMRPQVADYMYTISTWRRISDIPANATDEIVVIDIDRSSVTYGEIVHVAQGYRDPVAEAALAVDLGLDIDEVRGEYHHGHLGELDGRYFLAAPSLHYRNSHMDFFDLGSRRAPVLASYLTHEQVAAVGASALHTTHVNHQTGNIIVSNLGDGSGDGSGPSGFIEVSPNVLTARRADRAASLDVRKYFTMPVTGSNTLGVQADDYNYDFTINDCTNTLVATSWGPPSSFDDMFNPANPYGRSIRVFRMPEETGDTDNSATAPLTLLRSFTVDPAPPLAAEAGGEGVVPLEVRRTHVPGQEIYFVGITLPGAIDLIYKDEASGQWRKKIVISPEQLAADATNASIVTSASGGPLNGNTLGGVRVPLVTDITLSEDDHYLYVSCWLDGTLMQYDVRDPHNPVAVGGMGNLGGIQSVEGTEPNPHNYQYRPGRTINGGPQMLRLDHDGRNIFVTTSLFSSWDDQFYNKPGNSIALNGSQMIAIDTGVRKGEKAGPMTLDVKFGRRGVIDRRNRMHETHIIGIRH